MIIGRGIRQYVWAGKNEIKRIFGWCPWHLIFIKTRLRTDTRLTVGKQNMCFIKLDTKFYDEKNRVPNKYEVMRTSIVVHEITHAMQDAHAINRNLFYYMFRSLDKAQEDDSKEMNDRLMCLFRDSKTSKDINRILEFADGIPQSAFDDKHKMTDEILPKAVELIYQYEFSEELKGEYDNEYNLAKELVSKYKEELASPLVLYSFYFIKIIPYLLGITISLLLIVHGMR